MLILLQPGWHFRQMLEEQSQAYHVWSTQRGLPGEYLMQTEPLASGMYVDYGLMQRPWSLYQDISDSLSCFAVKQAVQVLKKKTF